MINVIVRGPDAEAERAIVHNLDRSVGCGREGHGHHLALGAGGLLTMKGVAVWIRDGAVSGEGGGQMRREHWCEHWSEYWCEHWSEYLCEYWGARDDNTNLERLIMWTTHVIMDGRCVPRITPWAHTSLTSASALDASASMAAR